MNNNIKNTVRMGVMAVAGAAAMISCSDTWDDHYNAAPVTVYDGTTMQAIEKNAPDFADVIKAVGYDRELASDNVYTVWAPQSFNKDSVMALVATNPKAVLERFVKNHVARYTVSQNGSDQKVSLMSSKLAMMTADGLFGSTQLIADGANLSCTNGVLHLIDTNLPYQNNLFEQIEAMHNEDTDSISLFSYLNIWNKDSLDEEKSVSRGVDENGEKIWVDSVTIRNNTMLNNIDALVYREDSNYIAIIPSAKAYEKRYNIAKSLLVFNPVENQSSTRGGTYVCDSLQERYANLFAMTDLFYNKNANLDPADSLMSTQYFIKTADKKRVLGNNWPNNLYYTQEPNWGMPRDKEVNDLLAKCGTPVDCSNGDAYLVDEYPMSVTEQFFRKIYVTASSGTIDQTTDDKGATIYTDNMGNTTSEIGTYDVYKTDTIWNEEDGSILRIDSTFVGIQDYYFYDIPPLNQNARPNVAFQLRNILSGTYDLYIVTVPIWAKNFGLITGKTPEDDPRAYYFRANIFEQNENGSYPRNGTALTPPAGSGSGRYFITDYTNPIDTLYMGEYTFKHAYYGRPETGVLLQLQMTASNTSLYSREMLISGFILKPKFEEVAADAAAEETKKR